jgi:hypothetical protein
MPDYRFELPEGLSPQDEAAALAALERYFAEERLPPPSAWALAGRIDASGLGAIQTRGLLGGWRSGARMAFARRGTPPLHGRGDAK